jgi:hypothetical protein
MTMSLDAAASSGDTGIACDAVIAAKLRPKATAAAASSLIAQFLSGQLPHSGGLTTRLSDCGAGKTPNRNAKFRPAEVNGR